MQRAVAAAQRLFASYRATSLQKCRANRFGAAGTLLVLALLACSMSRVAAQMPASPRATASRAARREAIELIPFKRLNEQQKAKVVSVIDNVSIYRRLPIQSFPCDPELYIFMSRHPEILANIWQILGIDDVTLHPVSPGVYEAEDGAGTTGFIEYLYQDDVTHLIYAEGTYDGPMFNKPAEGRCVLLLKSGFIREPDGRYYVTSRLDAFVELKNAGVELLAKTFQPLVARVADMSFMQTAGFVESLSHAAETTPGGLVRLADRLEQVNLDTRQRFIAVTAAVARRNEAMQLLANESFNMTRRPNVPTTARGQNR